MMDRAQVLARLPVYRQSGPGGVEFPLPAAGRAIESSLNLILREESQ
jgi:hypothetical protein